MHYATPAPYPPLDGSQACAQSDPELFFPITGQPTAPAKHLCSLCPLRRECLAFALTHRVIGVWGGTSEDDRDRLRRQHHIGKPVPFRYANPFRTPTPTPGAFDDDWS